jgi:hypothetical protein
VVTGRSGPTSALAVRRFPWSPAGAVLWMSLSEQELFDRIRRDSRQRQLSVRALSRKYGVHRRLVREALSSPVPTRAAGRSAGRPRPAVRGVARADPRPAALRRRSGRDPRRSPETDRTTAADMSSAPAHLPNPTAGGGHGPGSGTGPGRTPLHRVDPNPHPLGNSWLVEQYLQANAAIDTDLADA